jgi:cytochrome d ubiquinol oxidase subunit II
MLEILISILLLSIVTYTILAGADLGTGILEIFTSKHDDHKQSLLSLKALKPVWEVNHIWIGLIVIILFTVFPRAFFQIFTIFALPVFFIFSGLFIRAIAFTLKTEAKYSNISLIVKCFDYSSLWITFWMGNLVGALVQGKMTYAPSGFIQGFVSPWFSLFPALTGLFLIGLFAYIAAIFLHTETEDKLLKSILRKRAINANIFSFIIGGILLITGFLDKDGITFYFLQSTTSLISLLFATFLLVPSYFLLKTKKKFLMRAIASVQILTILTGLFGTQFPIIFQTNLDRMPKTFTFYNTISNNSSFLSSYIIVALAVFTIIPTYLYLFKIYKKKSVNQ